MAIKVDLMKAFDSISWDFIWSLLDLMGFPKKISIWIKACVTTAAFSLCINGGIVGFFKRKRGLRQGDLLSSLIFVLVMNALSLLLEKETTTQFDYHDKCKLNHLTFADDLFLFSKGDPTSANTLKNSLDLFCYLTGMQPNSKKSNIYFSRVSKK